ncbi:MAG: SsrA-binding protein SmpB [Clostridia bacterium]|nr:SsrA-binding protein SmpB [Clostridia bacterium]
MAGGKKSQGGRKLIAQNKKAFHDYFVIDRFESGIELSGTEVKSVRGGKVNMKDSYCSVEKGELIAHGIHISPYEQGNIFNRDPLRDRRLLMHRREINRLQMNINKDGYTLVPLSMYFDRSWVKVELGLCKGKKLYDKREADAKKEAVRDIERSVKDDY